MKKNICIIILFLMTYGVFGQGVLALGLESSLGLSTIFNHYRGYGKVPN